MDKTLYSILILTIAVFLTGFAENIFIGILPDVAMALETSESKAGSIISLFSMTYAIYAPFAVVVAYYVNTKSAIIASLAVFACSNLSMLIPEAGLLFIISSRIITAMASAQISVCAVIFAVNIAQEHFKARAIGIIYLGISGSLFLGVPVGVWLTHLSNWRTNGLVLFLFSGFTLFLIIYKLPNIKQTNPEENFRDLLTRRTNI